MTTIFLADDNARTRSALGLLFATRLREQDILEIPDWDSLLQHAGLASQNSASCKKVVILLDWELPGCPALEGHARLRAILPGSKIIALSVRPEARLEALQAGVDGFIAKSDPPEKVVEVLRRFLGD